MPPIWLCLDCEGIAYGWARGEPCIYCDSPNVIGTDDVYHGDELDLPFRLLFLSEKQWVSLEAEALLAGKLPCDLLAEREGAPVVRVQDEPAQNGKLILLKTDREGVALS